MQMLTIYFRNLTYMDIGGLAQEVTNTMIGSCCLPMEHQHLNAELNLQSQIIAMDTSISSISITNVWELIEECLLL
ncbi:hypothetical protein R6Q59_023648, partial [Mikania micrantha]